MTHGHQEARHVWFNAGGDQTKQYALVVADKGGTLLDLLVADENGAWGHKRDIARREPADYGPEGGGDTWHVG